MFRARQDSEQRKIRLPKRASAPGPDHLQLMLDQAFQYRGQEVELIWTDNSTTQQFTLVVKVERDKNDGIWSLLQDNGRQQEMMWSHETVDIELINNMLSMLEPLSSKTVDEPAAPLTKSASSPISPYRNLFSATYNGITPATANLKDSLLRMRPVTAAVPSASVAPATPAAPPAQTISTGAINPVSLSENAPSLAVKQVIADGLKRLAGNRQVMPVYVISETTVSGTLEQTGMQNAQLVELIVATKLTGKLEFNTTEMRGDIFFANGELHSAFAASSHGNEALTELFLCSPSSFRFTVGEQSPVRNISSSIEATTALAISLRDQLSHLERAGLKGQSIIIKVHASLSDGELRLLLMKNNAAIDIGTQIALYRQLNKKFTFSQFLNQGAMGKSVWISTLYNFYSGGLIEIKAPLSASDEQLEFLGDSKAAVLALKNTFLRKETNILTYPALLYFLQYEFLRYQSYDWPLSLVVFEMNKQSQVAGGGLDLTDQHETLTALQRIAVIKRPLDQLGHFETIDYALLLPNTTPSTANQIAHQIIQVLRAEPLSADLDEKLLKLSFGIASIPDHCDNIESIIILGKKALVQAKSGHFPVILASSEK